MIATHSIPFTPFTAFTEGGDFVNAVNTVNGLTPPTMDYEQHFILDNEE